MLQVLSTREMLPDAINCSDCRTQLEHQLQALTSVTSVSISERSIEIDATDSLEILKTQVKRVASGISSHHDHASFLVSGMDCADCARKVETAVTRMPGVTSSKVNFSTQKLAVGFDANKTKLEDFARIIEPLGYKVQALPKTAGIKAKFSVQKTEIDLLEKPETHQEAHQETHDHAHDYDHSDPSDEGKNWYQTRQGQLVLSSGGLLILAYLLGFIAPNFAVYGYIAATLVGVFPLVQKALASMRVGDFFSINFLVSIAALGALIIGEAPEGAVVVFFFAVGELLEGIAAGRARAGIKSLAALAPKTAQLIHGSHTHEVAASSLKIGQVVRVNAGARVPCDGTILAGSSSLDDSPVTGESVPVNKTLNDTVFAGSINTDSVLEVRVDKSSDDNTISRIIHMVEEAESGKAPTARFVERFSRSYTPFVVLAATLVILVPPLLFGGSWHDWLYKGLSILLIGCPCALVLSVPAAITSGISSGARRGLLIKGGAALEEFAVLKTIAFDKTGTLTMGQPKVTDVIGNELEVLKLAASVETGSSHPLAKAITDKAASLNLTLEPVTDAKAIQGKAVTANLGTRVLAVGSPRYAAELAPLSNEFSDQISNLENAGKTVVVLLENTAPLGLIAIRDEPRSDARDAILELKNLGISSLMLTGDNARTGKAIADVLGLEVRAELLPEDKLKLIGELKRTQKIGMVGDGINDAPALALADVGVAMGSGTDVALETADAALLKNSVRGVSELVQLSRAVMGNIRQNIIFALGLKAIFLVTTLLGLTNLWMAILSDTGATALVTANALRLLTFKPSSSLSKS